MTQLDRIKQIRRDISDYVLHCTKPEETGAKRNEFEVLKKILSDGYFLATRVVRHGKKTVSGPHPVVCFTEQPLEFFRESIAANHRYTPFAVAVRKDDLFHYGGRPVIYADGDTRDSLPDELKHLHVTFDPTAEWDGRQLDWTHEREWRVKPNETKNRVYFDGLSELSTSETVPLLLPKQGVGWKQAELHILTDTRSRAAEIKEWIEGSLCSISARGAYYDIYADVLREAAKHIISFEEVEERGLSRLEDFLSATFPPGM